MQRSLVFALVLLMCALGGAAWWFLRGDAPPPAPGGSSPTTSSTPAGPETEQVPLARNAAAGSVQREAVAGQLAMLLDDPEIRAGLCGFRGRIVDHQKTPVAECGVRIYRGAMDSVLPVDIDLFAAESTYVPNYIAGETKTAADGTWQLTGVWPRAFYLLFAGLGTDAPMHQVLTRTPAPGEVVDLGDIVLPNAGVITGTVVDDNGDPLAGALVRAADLPGTLAAFFPFERIDPEGALLVRESNFPQRVVLLPPWAKTAFDNLPIPSARTDAEGHFRLVGVVPGSNLLATTAKAFLSDVKPSVPVRAGQEKNVGTIRMKRGEELLGKVVDTAGKPIAQAEVLAGSTLSMAPVDLAQKVGRSDDEGRFRAQGFGAGKVSVAARRGPGHAWTLAEPQPILGEVVVTLPATFAVDATISLPDGQPAKDARLKLLQGRAGNGAAEMHLLGIVPAIDLQDRKRPVADGRWRLENLTPGSYTLLADAPGHAMGLATFDLATADTAVTIALTAPNVFTVVVVDPQDKPIRNAAIYGNARGERALDMPVLCGRTAADGKLVIDTLRADSLRVSADHPKWGVVHGEMKRNETLTLRMVAPGAVHGVLSENGKPPDAGKFTVAIERRYDGTRGAIETVPLLLTPGLDGTFATNALQPGNYGVEALKALDTLRSPGGVFALAQEAFFMRNLPSKQAQVVSGQTAEVVLEVGEKPLEGPTARLLGSLAVDGRVGAGHVVVANVRERRFTAKVDERGRFDLGTVPASELRIVVMATTDGMVIGPENNLWSTNLKLAEGEVRDLAIEVMTSSLAGVCTDMAGAPVEGLRIQAQGQLKGDEHHNNVWMSTITNAQGEFTFAKMAEGTWSLTARRDGRRSDNGVRGKLDGIQVTGGVPVTGLRIQVQPAIVVSGRIDLSSFGNKKAEWMWVSAYKLKDDEPNTVNGSWDAGIGVDRATGNIHTEELLPGRYRLQLYTNFGDNDNGEYPLDTIVVPPTGLSDLVLRPGARIVR